MASAERSWWEAKGKGRLITSHPTQTSGSKAGKTYTNTSTTSRISPRQTLSLQILHYHYLTHSMNTSGPAAPHHAEPHKFRTNPPTILPIQLGKPSNTSIQIIAGTKTHVGTNPRTSTLSPILTQPILTKTQHVKTGVTRNLYPPTIRKGG